MACSLTASSCSLSSWNLSFRLLRFGLAGDLSRDSSGSKPLPSVFTDEAVFRLVSETIEFLVGDAALREVARENHANGLDTFRVGGGGKAGLAAPA